MPFGLGYSGAVSGVPLRSIFICQPLRIADWAKVFLGECLIEIVIALLVLHRKHGCSFSLAFHNLILFVYID